MKNTFYLSIAISICLLGKGYGEPTQGGGKNSVSWVTPVGTFELVATQNQRDSVPWNRILPDIETVYERFDACEVLTNHSHATYNVEGQERLPVGELLWSAEKGRYRPEVLSDVRFILEVDGERVVVVPDHVISAYKKAFALLSTRRGAIQAAEVFRRKFNSREIAGEKMTWLQELFYVGATDGTFVPASGSLRQAAAENMRSALERESGQMLDSSVLEFFEVVQGGEKILVWTPVYEYGNERSQSPALAYIKGRWRFLVVQ